MASATDLGPAGPDNTYGSGRIDVLAADAWVGANVAPAIAPGPVVPPPGAAPGT